MNKAVNIFCFFIVLSAQAQQSYSFINPNGMKGYMNADGLLFDSLGNAGLYADAMTLVRNAGIWVSATDSLGNLAVAAHNVLGNNHDFWPGPLELQSGDAANAALWKKVYPISKSEISYHREHYKDVLYTPVPNIINWPGSAGTPYAQILAPFVDFQDGNMIYEPVKGDYPYIKCDHLVYGITNDKFTNHSYSNSMPLGIEIHTSLYAFEASDSFLANSLLVRYSVHNRSGKNYKNFRLSAVTNYKIGNKDNEYLGTDVETQSLFALNDTTEATFENKLVSSGCMAFNQKISSTMYFNNDTSPFNGKPTEGIHFFNLMQGRWKNGKMLSYGGDGTDGTGQANFVYPYNSDHSHGDTMWNEYGNDPGNRIGILNCDSVELKNGMAKTYDFVYFYVNENYRNIKQINHFCLNIKEQLNTKNLLDIGYVFNTKKNNNILFPNPAHAGDNLNIKKNLDLAMAIRIIDLNGKEIYNYNLGESENSIILPVSLVDGLYIVEIKTLNTLERQLININ